MNGHDRNCDGYPCECGFDPQKMLPVWVEFHRAWGYAKPKTEYEKEVWTNLEREILALISPAPELEVVSTHTKGAWLQMTGHASTDHQCRRPVTHAPFRWHCIEPGCNARWAWIPTSPIDPRDV